MLYGALECSIKCPKCDAPVFLNGPWETAHCDRCQADISIPHDYWTDMIGDIVSDVKNEFGEGDGRQSTIFGTFNTTLLYARLQAYCYECKEDFDPDENAAEPYIHTCKKCGHEIPVAPAPKWLKKGCKAVGLVVNADPEGKAEDKTPPASEPIVFSCLKCGGALEVDGTTRLVPCGFCGVKVYLPDDLWLRLHPAKTKKRWFVGFDKKQVPKKDDD
jgi:DNA-directed RNA polymerase subunit RPC12/RpoP